MGDRGPILRVWQKAFTELSTDSFKSNFGTHSTPMPRARYQEEGYQPPFETLPSEPDFLAVSRKLSMAPRGPLIENTDHLRRRLRPNHVLPSQRRCAVIPPFEGSQPASYVAADAEIQTSLNTDVLAVTLPKILAAQKPAKKIQIQAAA